MNCTLCPRKCGVDRTVRPGACHTLADMKICRIAPHFYEEPPISGKKGSGTIFFSGCSLDCEFCQNYEISKKSVGKTYTPAMLADAMRSLEKTGVHNINLVTPTHFSDKIKQALDLYRPAIPIVYNTSGYELPDVVRSLLPYVDIFLVDLKYSDNVLAEKYSNARNYVENCLSSIDVMVDNKPLVFEGEFMKQGVIVRHLVLPGETENTLKVIETFKERYLDRAYLSVMSQFVPEYHSSIHRTLSPLEYKIVLRRLFNLGSDKCFVQELSSASSEFIPPFDLSDE